MFSTKSNKVKVLNSEVSSLRENLKSLGLEVAEDASFTEIVDAVDLHVQEQSNDDSNNLSIVKDDVSITGNNAAESKGGEAKGGEAKGEAKSKEGGEAKEEAKEEVKEEAKGYNGQPSMSDVMKAIEGIGSNVKTISTKQEAIVSQMNSNTTRLGQVIKNINGEKATVSTKEFDRKALETVSDIQMKGEAGGTKVVECTKEEANILLS